MGSGRPPTETAAPNRFGRAESTYARVLAELVDLLGLPAAAVWASPSASPFELIASVGEWDGATAPPTAPDDAALDEWCRANGATGTAVESTEWSYAGCHRWYVAVPGPAGAGGSPAAAIPGRMAGWLRHVARA